MTGRCPDPLELDMVLRLPENDPRRLHVNNCPRCRGLVNAMETFLDPGEVPELDGLPAADDELAARLDKALPLPGIRSPRPRSRRIGLAAAAVLALCAIGLASSEILQVGSTEAPRPGSYQRGTTADNGVLVSSSSSGLHFVWPGAPAADAMIYTFLSQDMSELGRIQADGPLNLDADDPLALAPFCQALAVARGDTIGRSGISRLSPERE